MGESTSVESTSGHLESLEVKVGELNLKVTGKNTTEALMNLMKNVVDLETMPFDVRY
jgi:hypothetical protein